MVLLIIPLGQLALGGISEKYLPPDNAVRQAQNAFDASFPGYRTEKLTLVIKGATPEQIAAGQEQGRRRSPASPAPGTSGPSHPDVKDPEDPDRHRRTAASRACPRTCRACCRTVSRCATTPPRRSTSCAAIAAPKGVTIWVGGTPALEQDSIHSLFAKLPLMVVVLIPTTTMLMFLAFGSLVLPIKAALMSALTLGSTMGILTWMFVDGHGSGLMNYTPQPLMAPMIGLIIAVIWGLSTDYEVFLVSRMVEARARGMSTAEAIRIGTATTGRLITGAALILAVVAGAFVFSDLVMMKYLAFGLLIALLLDATIIRMFLVPAIMKMLGDDCWWAPQWMKRIQERLGLGEIELPDERKRPTVREAGGRLRGTRRRSGAPMPGRGRRTIPTHPAGGPRADRHRQGRSAAGQPAVGGRHHAHPDRTGRPRRAADDADVAPLPPTRPPGCRYPAERRDHAHAAGRPGTVRRPRRADALPGIRARARIERRGSREIESWLGDLRGGATERDDADERPPTRSAAASAAAAAGGRAADHRDPAQRPRCGRRCRPMPPRRSTPVRPPTRTPSGAAAA